MNKIYFLIFSLFILNLQGQAQTERGSKLLGGSASLQFSDPFSIGINPNLGIFLRDNFALGASLGLNYNTSNRYTNTNASLHPFARYYFGHGPTRIFTKASIGYGYGWQKYDDNFSEYKTSSGYTVGILGLGLTRFITKQIGIEASLDYSAFHSQRYHGNVYLSFGFQIYLPFSRTIE